MNNRPETTTPKEPLRTKTITPDINPIDFRFSMDFFLRVPDAPGVFWMQDSRRQVLFVDATEKLRSELLQFKNIPWQQVPGEIRELYQKVKQIDWNSTANREQALEMKKVMVRQCQPPFNKKTKTAVPFSIQIVALTPNRVQLHWGEMQDVKDNQEYQLFGPFYGRNTLHRTYSAILRWIWIVGSQNPPENIPPYLLKPLLRNDMEVPIDQLFFENQRWINSLSRFLNGYSDLFLDFGLRRIEDMPDSPQCKIPKELFEEDLIFLDRFFKRYSNVNLQVPGPAPQ